MKPYYENPGQNLPVFTALFERVGLDWAVIGGIAAVERRPDFRETVDVDFVVSEMAHLEERLNELQPKRLRVLRESGGTPYLIQGETSDGMHFDIYIASIEFEKAVLATKDENHFASAEAIIVYKLMAMRPHDIDDIRSILARPAIGSLDIAFIEHWAEECGVLDRWREFAT